MKPLNVFRVCNLEMSFIFAEKVQNLDRETDETIKVYCDTKVSAESTIGAGISRKLQRQLEKYGIIKSTIICPEFCISYAGNNAFLASNLFHKLYEMKEFFREDVLREAYDVHIAAKNPSDIEFIICSVEDGSLHIDCIKDNKLSKDVSSAWLGSFEAFNSFQGYRLKSKAPIQNKSSQAFREVVSGCGDDTVGGFPIAIQYYHSDNSFEYVEEYGFISNKEQAVLPGEDMFFYTGARDGGMSYRTIPMGVGSVIFDIDQMQNAILYSRDHRYDNKLDTGEHLLGIMLPMEIMQENNVWKSV